MGKIRTDPRWIVAITQPQREKWAGENVARQGHTFYLPMCRELISGSVRERPLFPRYLFVRVTMQWRFLFGTFGVIDVILDEGEVPAVVPDRIIDSIQKSATGTGIIDLLPTGVDEDSTPGIGDEVVITDGPFEGLVGPLVGKDSSERVRVLLSVFGRKVETKVARREVRAA